MLIGIATESNLLHASLGPAMRLTDYTDYALRVLMYCAAHDDRLVTITELAQGHGLSRNHLMKVVQGLAHQGLLETTRGRGGGLRLSRPAGEIRVGEVVRATETDFRLVECFDPATDRCTLTPRCRLRHVLLAAQQAWFRTLDDVTLADLVPAPRTARSRPNQAPRRRAAAS